MSWFRSRLFRKTCGLYVLLSGVALAALLLSLHQHYRHHARRMVETDARGLLQRLRASQWASAPEANLSDSASRILLPPERSLLICRRDGTILDGTNAPPAVSDTLRRRLIHGVRSREFELLWDPAATEMLYAATRANSAGTAEMYLILAEDAREQLAYQAGLYRTALTTTVITWLCSTLCMAIVTALVIRPVGMLVGVLRAGQQSAERRDLLIRLQERRDEFGGAARALKEIDEEQQQRLHDVKQQEREMRFSATQLSAVLQAMVEGVVAVDAQERILFANKVACSMLTMDPDRVAGRPVFEAVRDTHFQAAMHDANTGRKQSRVEIRMAKNAAHVSLVASPIPGGGAVLVMADVTEVRRLESMRRDFVSGVSHELKTPLTVIQACTETLLDGAVDDRDTARNFLQQIEEQSERLLQLILGMLQLARVESGEYVLERGAVDLAEAARQIRKAMLPVAKGKKISLSVRGESELFVLADYQAVRTVVGNLVDNALKYTPAGGEVLLELATDDDAAILSVADSGVGIPEKEQHRVFERFYRVERDRNRERGGTGLGLSIVKHLCQAMNAEIRLQSSVGRGCTITVRFPFQD